MTEQGGGPAIYRLMAEAMRRIEPVEKSRVNEAQKFRFRGIDDLMNATHDVFAELGIVVIPSVLDVRSELEEREAHGRTLQWHRVGLLVRYTFYAPDGSSIEAVTYGLGLDQSDKAANKAMSAAFKYALIQSLDVPTVDTEDSDRHSPEVEGSRPAAPAQRPGDGQRMAGGGGWNGVWSRWAVLGFRTTAQRQALIQLEWPDGEPFGRRQNDQALRWQNRLLRYIEEQGGFDGATDVGEMLERVRAAMVAVMESARPQADDHEP